MAGGWKGNQNSIKFGLLPYRAACFGGPMVRKCSRCGRPAVRDKATCAFHSGSNHPLRATPGRLASRTLDAMDRRGLLPLELISLPLWRDLAPIRTEVRAPVRLALVQAWDRRHDEPLRWARVWREARAACDSEVPMRSRPSGAWADNL